MFEQFGEIKSYKLMKNSIGLTAFVCYEDPLGVDKEYGPDCARKAIKDLHGKELQAGLNLYVKYAMKKSDREDEKKKESFIDNNSMVRCNLFVKNFPVHWDKELATILMNQLGVNKVVAIRLLKENNNGVVQSIQAYNTNPTKYSLNAMEYKNQKLQNNAIFEGQTLKINFEIQEERKIQKEDTKEKS